MKDFEKQKQLKEREIFERAAVCLNNNPGGKKRKEGSERR
jgi:hypothetical protein